VLSVALAGGVWIGLSIWAAQRTQPMIAPREIGRATAEALVVGTTLLVALAGHALFYGRVAGGPVFMPAAVVAAVWAGLTAGDHVAAADALGLVLVTAAWLGLARPGASAAPMAVLTGIAIALSPLLIGSILGLWLTVGGKEMERWRFVAIAGWLLTGAVLATGIGVAVGQPPWEVAAQTGVMGRFGPAAAWRHLAGLVDLVAPVLAVGALGAVVAQERHVNGPIGYAPRQSGGARVRRGLAAWLVCNVVLASALPAVSAEHALVLLAPAALLVATGWSALRALVARSAPLTAALPGAVCLFLLVVLLLAPARAAARIVLLAVLPP
jgi:hypothetical protein